MGWINLAEYQTLYERSIKDPESFWDDLAEESMADIYWFKRWGKVFKREYPGFKWFSGGHTNAGYNCVDYKQRYSDKTAYIYEMPELGISRKITYGQLFDLVKKYSASLRGCGITKGDRVLLYLPTTIEAIAILQASARVGAISTTVFAGFSPRAIADRIEATTPRLIFTQDFSVRRGKILALKSNIDQALGMVPHGVAEQVNFIVIRRQLPDKQPPMKSERDIWLEEFEQKGEGYSSDFEQLEANETLFVMCTSGTTAKPKPVVHVHGGFQIWVYWTAKWVYGLNPDDIIFNTSDIGWIVGQSYLAFGPLLVGCTTILYDGVPDYPTPDLWWKMMEKHGVTVPWMAPTGVRVLRKLGVEEAKKCNLRSIQRVVCAGEVLNPDVWNWLYKDVFNEKIPVFDHMWQTEVPGSMFGYPIGDAKSLFKPGSAGLPMPGVIPEILDERTGQKAEHMQKGILALKNPVPGMTPTLWMDPERYQSEYWENRLFTKGMYFTGDAAHMDHEGYIFFDGRSDEVIKISGHRIGTVEIESALVSHPAITEAAVVGIPDELRGEVALGFVSLMPGYSPSNSLRQELIDHVRRTIGPFILFKTIEFVELIPKTRSGKIMRRIMKRLWTGDELGDLSTIEEDTSVDEIRKVISKFKDGFAEPP